MITEVKNVSVYVTDVDRAIAFYTQALGFDKRSDARMARSAGRSSRPRRAAQFSPWPARGTRSGRPTRSAASAA